MRDKIEMLKYNMTEKKRAPRNRTVFLTQQEWDKYRKALRRIDAQVSLAEIQDSTICQDFFQALPFLL